MNKLIMETLKNIDIPVHFQVYSGTKTTYATFSTYLEKGEEFADDKEVLTGFYVQLDVFSKSSLTSLTKLIKEKMILSGFTRTYETELYEEDTELYHKVLRFYYAKEVE